MIGIFAGIIMAVACVDLGTKFIFDGVLNTGIAWGLGAQWPWLWIAIVVLSAVLAVVCIVWYCRSSRRHSWWFTVGLALFVGGVIGNAVDRCLTGGAVHDFINFVLFKNNLADMAIIAGAIMVGGQIAFR